MKRGHVATDQGQRCGNCKHYKDETEAGDTEAHGECRRFPRTWVADEEGYSCLFVVAYPEDVCGEWKAGQ